MGCAVKLIDYGLACVDRAARGSLPRLAGCTRERKGTPAFMDPNAHDGGLTKPAADIWALGVTLYWLLFNEHLFAGANGLDSNAIYNTPAIFNCYWGTSAPQISSATQICRNTVWRDGMAGKRATADELWDNFGYVSEDVRYWALYAESLEVDAIGHAPNYQPPRVITDAVMPFSTWLKRVVLNPFS